MPAGHIVLDHEQRCDRIAAPLVRSRNRSMLFEEVATG
jgi:hypothetical protein